MRFALERCSQRLRSLVVPPERLQCAGEVDRGVDIVARGDDATKVGDGVRHVSGAQPGPPALARQLDLVAGRDIEVGDRQRGLVIAPPAPQDRHPCQAPSRGSRGVLERPFDEREGLRQPVGPHEMPDVGDRAFVARDVAIVARAGGGRFALAQQRGDGGAEDSHAGRKASDSSARRRSGPAAGSLGTNARNAQRNALTRQAQVEGLQIAVDEQTQLTARSGIDGGMGASVTVAPITQGDTPVDFIVTTTAPASTTSEST